MRDDGSLISRSTTKPEVLIGGIPSEDVDSRTVVWLLCRVCNFIADNGGLNKLFTSGQAAVTCNNDSNGHSDTQHILATQWRILRRQFDVWSQDLPTTFKPSARTKSKIQRPFTDFEIIHPIEKRPHPFDEICYDLPMCAATMMHYHMARILLLISMPQESEAHVNAVGTITSLSTERREEVVQHCYEIWYVALPEWWTSLLTWPLSSGIASARPAAAVRTYMVQPLYVAGRCLTHHRERKAILDLLKGIQKDLGWSTKDRVQQLEREWGWVAEDDVAEG